MTTRAERRAFLERSLADLDEEHDAGDLGDADHARLKADYERRLAVLDGRATPAARPATPGGRPWVVAAATAAVLAFAVLAGVLVAQSAGRRDPGDTITGADLGNDAGAGTGTGTGSTVPEGLAACFDLVGSDAFDCYIGYTRANPEDADGFLYFGLYAVNQGLQTDTPELLEGGETFLRRALELDPAKVEARVNLAVLLERTGRDEEAGEQLDALDGVELTADLQQLVDFVAANLAAPEATTTTAG